MKKVALFWSGGKDAALALYQMLQNPEIQVVKLICVFHRHTNRLAMHGVRPEVIREQIRKTGIESHEMWVEGEGNKGYELALRQTYELMRKEGVDDIAYGDIFLESLRQYRQTFLDEFNFKGLYPLWKMNTQMLAEKYIRLGFESLLICVDDQFFSEQDLFTLFGYSLLSRLPQRVDPCGENGEFHTLCINAPYFKAPILVEPGEVVHRDLGLDSTNNRKIGFLFGDVKLSINNEKVDN